jgi:hypothetical protein
MKLYLRLLEFIFPKLDPIFHPKKFNLCGWGEKNHKATKSTKREKLPKAWERGRLARMRL